MNGPNMEEPPFERVKTRRRKGRCPVGARLRAVACGDESNSPEVEALFQSYNLKLEQTATLKALAVLIVAASSLSLVELLSSPRLTLSKGSYPVHCVVFLSLFIVTNVKYLHVTQLQQIAKLSLLFSFTFALLCCPFPLALGTEAPVSAVAPEQGMWQLMLVTLVAYVLLPVRTLLAVLFGAMLAASHFIVIATSLAGREPRLWRPVSEVRIPAELFLLWQLYIQTAEVSHFTRCLQIHPKYYSRLAVGQMIDISRVRARARPSGASATGTRGLGAR